MSRQIYAITTCRVSTPEQEENMSLVRQAKAVKKAAKSLGAIIPVDGQWSGSVSSKVGKNVERKDLKQMLAYCRKNKQVKYLLVHEVDRFMRSVDELFYFEVVFRTEVGVTVYYASQPQLNTNDHNAKLLKALEVFKAESSNVERITKSISGQTDALKEGRYPFGSKPGYRKAIEPGVKVVHSVTGPILKTILLDIYSKRLSPTDALVKLNKSEFSKHHSPLKMDKFRRIVMDSYYAGVVECHAQVDYRNENGRHEALITLEQHYEILRIMDSKKKNQTGPRKNGNPDFPLSNLVTCEGCKGTGVNRYVGFKHSNGKNANLVYYKYRCRSCKKYIQRDELHSKVSEQFNISPITNEGRQDFLEALEFVWRENEAQSKQDLNRIRQNIRATQERISAQAIAAIEPENAPIKTDILANIAKDKTAILELEKTAHEISNTADADKSEFLEFAYRFIDNMGQDFLEIDKRDRLKCKQIVFPSGFYIKNDNKVYTPEISPLITLIPKKKSTEVLDNSLMVQPNRIYLNFFRLS